MVKYHGLIKEIQNERETWFSEYIFDLFNTSCGLVASVTSIGCDIAGLYTFIM